MNEYMVVSESGEYSMPDRMIRLFETETEAINQFWEWTEFGYSPIIGRILHVSVHIRTDDDDKVHTILVGE